MRISSWWFIKYKNSYLFSKIFNIFNDMHEKFDINSSKYSLAVHL